MDHWDPVTANRKKRGPERIAVWRTIHSSQHR
jgi:hypothetical protein